MGPTLLLVHDGFWSFVWGQVIDRLRDRFRVITLDFPGSGLSPAADRAVGLESDSFLLEAFVDQMALDRVTLVAHDLGGPVGIGIGLRRPELIDGMVLANTFAWPPAHRGLRAMFAIMSSRPITAFNVATNLVPRLSSGNFGVGRHLDNAQREAFLGGLQLRHSRLRFHQLMSSARISGGYLASLETALRTTLHDRPVLTIYGERNDPFGFQARFKEILPHAEELVVPKGNHFPMCDDPDGFAHRIATWHQRLIT